MISIGRKLFEEVDKPLESKIVSEDNQQVSILTSKFITR
jgi:hypothetical protein